MRLRVFVGTAAAAVALAGCSSAVSGTPSAAEQTTPPSTTPADSDLFGSPASATPTALVPPIGLSLQGMVVDPDPTSEGPVSGTLTIDRLTTDKLLPTTDIHCLNDNGFRVGFAKDAAGEPAMTVSAYQLATPEGATNCVEQMKRTDQSAGTVTDLRAAYQLAGVDVYRIEAPAGRDTAVIFRGLYTSGDRLFRITVSQLNVAPAALEGRFRDLLRRQVALAPAS